MVTYTAGTRHGSQASPKSGYYLSINCYGVEWNAPWSKEKIDDDRSETDRTVRSSSRRSRSSRRPSIHLTNPHPNPNPPPTIPPFRPAQAETTVPKTNPFSSGFGSNHPNTLNNGPTTTTNTNPIGLAPTFPKPVGASNFPISSGIPPVNSTNPLQPSIPNTTTNPGLPGQVRIGSVPPFTIRPEGTQVLPPGPFPPVAPINPPPGAQSQMGTGPLPLFTIGQGEAQRPRQAPFLPGAPTNTPGPPVQRDNSYHMQAQATELANTHLNGQTDVRVERNIGPPGYHTIIPGHYSASDNASDPEILDELYPSPRGRGYRGLQDTKTSYRGSNPDRSRKRHTLDEPEEREGMPRLMFRLGHCAGSFEVARDSMLSSESDPGYKRTQFKLNGIMRGLGTKTDDDWDEYHAGKKEGKRQTAHHVKTPLTSAQLWGKYDDDLVEALEKRDSDVKSQFAEMERERERLQRERDAQTTHARRYPRTRRGSSDDGDDEYQESRWRSGRPRRRSPDDKRASDDRDTYTQPRRRSFGHHERDYDDDREIESRHQTYKGTRRQDEYDGGDRYNESSYGYPSKYQAHYRDRNNRAERERARSRPRLVETTVFYRPDSGYGGSICSEDEDTRPLDWHDEMMEDKRQESVRQRAPVEVYRTRVYSKAIPTNNYRSGRGSLYRKD